MTANAGNAERLIREGIAALQVGRAQQAHGCFNQALLADPDAAAHLLLAQACRMLGDDAGEKTALDRHLEREPRHLPALLLMAEHHARAGDDRAASAFYQTAFAVAAQPGMRHSAAIEAMLHRGEAFMVESNRRFTAHLDSVTGAATREQGTRRVEQAIDLLLGRTQLYLQQPTMFYFPGLPQRQFYERDEFAWIAEIEAATPQIRRELERVLAQDPEFHPYVQRNSGRPAPSNHLLGDPSWGAFDIWRGGTLIEENAARCPATVAALQAVPAPVIAGRSPMALFSRLKPGTHIQPHNGVVNTRLICHLPILAPADCGLRVGNETRAWREGEMLIFDDTVEHEAWNHSQEERVVLLFEIWRPEITAAEREGLVPIFEAIGTYGIED